MAHFVFLLQTIDMNANADKVLRAQLSRRPRFLRLRRPTAEKASQRSKICSAYWNVFVRSRLGKISPRTRYSSASCQRNPVRLVSSRSFWLTLTVTQRVPCRRLSL
jgi:hypothetical protein